MTADLREVIEAELHKVVKKLNDRPQKQLGYRVPAQVLLRSPRHSRCCTYCLNSGFRLQPATPAPCERDDQPKGIRGSIDRLDRCPPVLGKVNAG